MKHIFAVLVLTSVSSLQAAPPACSSEAQLPEGWPEPGPYNEVVLKKYPAYRAAFTSEENDRGAFMKLFMHIKAKDIPMTAPVEMPVDPKGDGEMNQTGMAFLYQNTEVGQKGPDGKEIEVRDIPAKKVLTFAWMGSDSEENRREARLELEVALIAKNLTPKSFRLLGYNGPGTPDSKKTWELQAIVK